MCIKRMVSLCLLLITALVLSSCGNREEDSFRKVMEVTYNVEDSSLWLDIEVKGDEKSQPESEYDRAISFYKQFTNANIT